MTCEMIIGQEYRFTKDIQPVGGDNHPDACMHAGDLCTYLGNSQVRITTGNYKNWVMSLLISAPLDPVEERPTSAIIDI